MLVYPSGIDLYSRALRYLAGRLAARRGEIGARRRRLTAGRQALLALDHLRCGDTYAQLAAGFGIAQGKHHTQALLCLARRRADVLFAMLRDGTFYESRPTTVA
ncbi:transposase family protein [Streptomyces anulatus]|uniref:transposase family protein n=1 Tax=Streptomyces TaxID=1883 RepID=UPI00365F176A